MIFFLTLLVAISDPSYGSRILFYSPFTAKSASSCMVPLANELARRGHSVVMVTQWPDMGHHKDIVHLDISNQFKGVQNILSKGLLTTELNPKPVFADISAMYDKSFVANLEALDHLKPLIESNVSHYKGLLN